MDIFSPESKKIQKLSDLRDKRIRFVCWLAALTSIIIISLHVFYPIKDSIVVTQTAKYKNVISKRNDVYLQLKNEWKSSKDFNDMQYKLLMDNYIELQDLATKEFSVLRKLVKEAKVFYFNNMKVFLFQMSVFFVMLLVSILFKLLVLQLEHESLKKTYQYVSTIFLAISFYHIIWGFYNSSDLPYFLHIIAVTVIAILISIFTNSFINWLHFRKSIISIHKHNFRNLWRFIIRDVPIKHIPKEGMKDYVIDYTKEIETFKTSSNND